MSNEGDGRPGLLAIKTPWPSQMRTVYGDHQRMIDTYYSMFKGYYFTGDGCRRDEDGYYWITGRVDDVINVSGHRMGTAEVESALVLHARVLRGGGGRAAPRHQGQGIYCYVVLMKGGETPSDPRRRGSWRSCVEEIGPIASPDIIQCGSGLPKTRSGKIMRRILRGWR